MAFYEQNGTAANDLIGTECGRYSFCRFCEMENDCDHTGPKLTEKTRYVLHYIYEFEAGITIYPLPGSWEMQPLWFDELFGIGRAELKRIRREKQEEEAKRMRHK